VAELTKERIVDYSRSIGSELTGFAPVGRWAEYGDLPEAFHPKTIWPWAETVIVLLVPSLLPTVETKISHIYRSQYHNTNSLLDEMAYRLAALLNQNGSPALNVCRDGYGIGPIPKKPLAAFSNVWAGRYAGLGTIGWNHCLITKEFGPRHRLVSIITALKLEPDPMIDGELCNKCLICEKACPGQVFSGAKADKHSDMNRTSCTERRKNLPYSHCGFCIKYCPVGQDRDLYMSKSVRRYFEEVKNLDAWESGIGGKIPVWQTGV
jgi:epoxyqueuosine reductase QueG